MGTPRNSVGAFIWVIQINLGVMIFFLHQSDNF